MDQDHIQDDSMVESYLRHRLTREERTQFEAHLVDCDACRDRVLLAEMFHVRNGLVRQEQNRAGGRGSFLQNSSYRPARVTPLPKRARFVAGLKPWQIWVILTTQPPCTASADSNQPISFSAADRELALPDNPTELRRFITRKHASNLLIPQMPDY